MFVLLDMSEDFMDGHVEYVGKDCPRVGGWSSFKMKHEMLKINS